MDEDSPLLVLLRELFIETGAEYNVKELAAELGHSVFSIYKKFAGERPLGAETLIYIVRFIHDRNPKDMRLINHICGTIGHMAVPQFEGKHGEKIQAIMTDIAELVNEERRK